MKTRLMLIVTLLCLAMLPVQAGPDPIAGVEKIYVVDFEGDIPKKWGPTLASIVSDRLLHALADHQIQVFTRLNLAQQLKIEEQKRILQCKEDEGCIEELIDGFGISVKLFGHVTKLGKGKYNIALVLMKRGKPLNKVVRVVTATQDGLLDIVPVLALELVGRGQTISSGNKGAVFKFAQLQAIPKVRAVTSLETSVSGLDFRNANIEELEAYDRMTKFDKGNADPRSKAEKWRKFAKKHPKYTALATKRANEWEQYAIQLEADWSKLSRLLKLSIIPKKDKQKWQSHSRSFPL